MRRRLIISLVMVPLFMGILALWLASSEMALQWAAKSVSEASNGTVTVTGLTGSLANTLRVEQLRYQTPEQTVQIEHAEMTWSPIQLLLGRVVVDHLSAKAVTVERLKPSGEPIKLPKRVRSPLDLHIEQTRISRLTLISESSRTELRDLRFRLVGDNRRWQLHDFGVDTAYGKISGATTIGTSRPFRLDGAFQFSNEEVQASAKLGGSLEDPSVALNFSGYGANGQATLDAKPFDSVPLRSLEINAQSINPARIQSEWPQADLRLVMNAKAGNDGLLNGALTLTNSQYGTLDQNKLPFQSAKAQLAGTVHAARLDNILLDLGQAGEFTGDSQAIKGKTVLTLRTQKFDLNGISSKLVRTAIAGDIVLTSKGDAQTLDARLGQKDLRLNVKAAREAQLLRLEQAKLRAGNGEVHLSGKMQLAEKNPFVFDGTMRNFNPAKLGAYPNADLNLDFGLQGILSPQWLLALNYEIRPSRLLNHPLAGRGSLKVDAQHVHDVQARLALGPNNVAANGNFGLPGERLKWQLNAPELAVLGHQFNGAINGKGELGGTPSSPHVSLLLDGKEVMFDGYGAKTLRASTHISEGINAPLQADITLSGAVSERLSLQSLQASARGTRQNHHLQLAARHKDGNFSAEAIGGWRSGRGWSGKINTLKNRGKYALSLKQPASLQIGLDGYTLQDMVLGLAEGSLHIDTLKKTKAHFSSRGTATGVPLSWLITLSPDLDERLDTDLIIGADWALEENHAVLNGNVHVFREVGDITLRGNMPTPLGLTTLDAQMQIAKNSLQANLKLAGKNVGIIQMDAASKLGRKQGGWALSKQSPLHLAANANMPSLTWLGWISADRGIAVDGKLALSLVGNGTIGKPNLSGDITGDNLALRWAEQGVHLHDGVLRAQLKNDRLQIRQASFKGKEGTLHIEGNAGIQNAQLIMDLRLIADKMMLLSRPDRVLVISGNSTLLLDHNRLTINGKMQADRARLEFPELEDVTISEDVVVLGQEQMQTQKALPIHYDLAFNLGRDFRVKGSGLDALLSGSVQLYSTQDRLPNARGTIQVDEGIYKAYGQKLAIQRGLITFSGPIENPALNILAVRKVPSQINAVEAGILVRGTARSPRASLVSSPEVPDTEKLSWLVLGKGTDMTSQQDFNVLMTAANALFGSDYGASLQSGLATAFGVDELSISNAAELDNAILQVGKRLSRRFYLLFEQSISGATSVAKLRYELSRRLTVEVGTGTMSAVDIIYNVRFD